MNKNKDFVNSQAIPRENYLRIQQVYLPWDFFGDFLIEKLPRDLGYTNFAGNLFLGDFSRDRLPFLLNHVKCV